MEQQDKQLRWSGTVPDTDPKLLEDGWREFEWSLREEPLFHATVSVDAGPSDEPFWCIPGLFWGDNQQDRTDQYYPRFNASLKKPARFESTYWEFDVWRTAQPVSAVYDGRGWTVLEVAPYATIGERRFRASVGFEWVDGRARLLASIPRRDRPYRNAGTDYTAPVEERLSVEKSETVRWQVRVCRVESALSGILGFLRRNYHAVRTVRVPDDSAAYARATRNALLRWHYHPELRYFRYAVAFDRVGQQIAEGSGASLDRHEMPLGWVNGWPVFEALIQWSVQRADADAMRAVSDTWDSLQSAGLISPSGFWWTRHAPMRTRAGTIFDAKTATGFDGNWMRNPEHLHVRTLGDALWRAARCLRAYRDAIPFAHELQGQVSDQAERIAQIARNGWPLPLSVHAKTGAPAGLQGTAAMIWLSVWSELAQMGLWEDLDLIRSGLDHYRNSVVSGQLFGAPEDVGSCVSSEDIYIALNVYLDGYALFGRDKDLQTAIEAASWLYFWQKSFKHEFDSRTLIGAYDLNSRGGQLASFKNNHLHIYGLDADRALRRLAEITGEGQWAALADDHWAFSSQLTPLIDGQFNAYEGMVTEQFYFIDWSALGNSVRFLEEDDRRSDYDVGPFGRNHGNLAGFSNAWCTAFVLRTALDRESPGPERFQQTHTPSHQTPEPEASVTEPIKRRQ